MLFFSTLPILRPFAKLIKSISDSVKVILCSHGNESGDYLHDIIKHEKYIGIKKKSATYNLGNMLLQEATFRKYIDVVLTVSDVEENIEKWLGAKAVYMVPRFIEKSNKSYNPIAGRVGFISDLSHEPNFFGIQHLCSELELLDNKKFAVNPCWRGNSKGARITK